SLLPVAGARLAIGVRGRGARARDPNGGRTIGVWVRRVGIRLAVWIALLPVGVGLAIGLRGRGSRTCRARRKGVLRLLVRWPTSRLRLGLLGVRRVRRRLGREVGLRLREGVLCSRHAEGLARLRVGVLGLGRGLRPRVRGLLSLDVDGLVAPGAVVTEIAHGPTLEGSGAPLLPDAHADHDGRAGEAEVRPQATLDEAPIPVLEEPAGEDHEPWWPGTGLGREQDPRLLAATERMRV